MNTDNAKRIINDLVARFQTGDISPLVKIAVIAAQPGDKVLLPSSKWSFLNKFIAVAETGTLDCRGFNQWKQVGRTVKKGEHATYILGPITAKITDKTTGEEKVVIRGFHAIPVFASHQTEGEPLPEIPDYTPETMPPLFAVAEAWGIDVSYIPQTDNYYGYFQQSTNQIALATHEEKVFFHELAHAAHARHVKLINGQVPDQEIIAEFTATLLSSMFANRDLSGNAWSYITHYAPEDPIKAIIGCLAMIETIIKDIVTTAEGLSIAIPAMLAEPAEF